jgi:hypothetical protein
MNLKFSFLVSDSESGEFDVPLFLFRIEKSGVSTSFHLIIKAISRSTEAARKGTLHPQLKNALFPKRSRAKIATDDAKSRPIEDAACGKPVQ